MDGWMAGWKGEGTDGGGQTGGWSEGWLRHDQGGYLTAWHHQTLKTKSHPWFHQETLLFPLCPQTPSLLQGSTNSPPASGMCPWVPQAVVTSC